MRKSILLLILCCTVNIFCQEVEIDDKKIMPSDTQTEDETPLVFSKSYLDAKVSKKLSVDYMGEFEVAEEIISDYEVDLAGAGYQNAGKVNYEVTLEKGVPASPESIMLDSLSVLETIRLKIVLISNEEISFKMDNRYKNLAFEEYSSYISQIEDNAIRYKLNVIFNIYSPNPGPFKLEFDNNIIGNPFEVFLDFGKKTADEIIAESGFEKFMDTEPSTEDLISMYGEPSFRTEIFSNGVQVLTYYYYEGKLKFNILVVNGKVKEYKRRIMKQNGAIKEW